MKKLFLLIHSRSIVQTKPVSINELRNFPAFKTFFYHTLQITHRTRVIRVLSAA